MSGTNKNGDPERKKESRFEIQHDIFFSIHKIYNIGNKEKSLIDQFVSKIKNIFIKQKPETKEESSLLGRIQELDKNAAEVLEVLNAVREDLKKEVDQDFYPFVEAIMNPMIRDISRIQKVVSKEGIAPRQLDAFNQYNDWINRAKLFVSVCSTAKNKEAISEAIIRHTMEDFNTIIERDLQLIADYQEHLLDELDILGDHKIRIKESLQKRLKPYFKNLLKLKEYPDGINLDSLNQWKEEFDKKRDHYFNAILQVIDNKVDGISPSKQKQEDHDLLVGSFEQIFYLETEIPLLIEKIEENNENAFERGLTIQQLMALEDEVDSLYHDIKMPHSIIERLDSLKKELKRIFKKLKLQ